MYPSCATAGEIRLQLVALGHAQAHQLGRIKHNKPGSPARPHQRRPATRFVRRLEPCAMNTSTRAQDSNLWCYYYGVVLRCGITGWSRDVRVKQLHHAAKFNTRLSSTWSGRWSALPRPFLRGLGRGLRRSERCRPQQGRIPTEGHIPELRLRPSDPRPAPIYDPTFSRTVWRLYGGAKGS
jgi:hypothetical protein